MKKLLYLLLIFYLFPSLEIKAQHQQKNNSEFSYDNSLWYNTSTVKHLNNGDYTEFLSEFDFVHDSIPKNLNQDYEFSGFYLGNGQLGMIVDPFGSQSMPYHLMQYVPFWRSGLDSIIGATKSNGIESELWYFKNNTFPCISTVETWVKDKSVNSQGNEYGRGFLGVRLSAFPTINNVFDPSKIDNYSQRLVLSSNQCITAFTYDKRVEVRILSYTSWKENSAIVYNVELTNISDEEIKVGFVAEPIVSFRAKQLEFTSNYKQLSLTIPATTDGLVYNHYLNLGATCNDKILKCSNKNITDSYTLKRGEKRNYAAYFTIHCSTDKSITQSMAAKSVTELIAKGSKKVNDEHIKEVNDFWRQFYVLLPWKDLCKIYYRNILISVGNFRFGNYPSGVSMLANPSYFGLSYGMDDMPAYELLMQLGRTDYLANVVNYFGKTMPEDSDNKGNVLNYDFDIYPWRTYILCNTPGNYTWLLYEYYRHTHDEKFLRETLYPMMRNISNFYTGYAGEINGKYGLWTGKQYKDKRWVILTYDEKVFTKAKEGYSWGEADNPTDVVGPAKLALDLTIKIAQKLGVDEDLVPKWQSCYDRLEIPQNDKYYLQFLDRPDGKGLGVDDFPNRGIMTSALFNLIYPTPLKTNDAKLENCYFAMKDTLKSHFEWDFNYNQQLWAAVGRMRLGKEMEWLMTKSKMRLGDALHKDGMMFGELSNGRGSGYFFMPYAMIPASINEMLMQSYDGVIKVFPALFPGFKGHDLSFMGLHALDGFIVSAKQNNGETSTIEITSKLGNSCTLEVPLSWDNVVVTDTKSGRKVNASSRIDTIRIEREEREVTIVTFKTIKNIKYKIENN